MGRPPKPPSLPNNPRASHIGLEILAKIHLLETTIRFKTRHPIFSVFHVFIANYIAIIQVIFHVIWALKCTRSHHFASRYPKFFRGWHPRTPLGGAGSLPAPRGYAAHCVLLLLKKPPFHFSLSCNFKFLFLTLIAIVIVNCDSRKKSVWKKFFARKIKPKPRYTGFKTTLYRRYRKRKRRHGPSLPKFDQNMPKQEGLGLK